MRHILSALALAGAALCATASADIPLGSEVGWDGTSIIVNSRRVLPAMGEVHFSRIPADEWADEIKKMKDGGISIIAAYCFWNHHEEEEGVYDWSGRRNLRRFLQECKKQDMPVIVRLGPFCHGEVRNGGIPDWMFAKGCRLRSEDPVFLEAVTALYRQIYTQVQGLQWSDGGPVLGVQFDNEYRGNGSYLMALKRIAHEIGFDLPIYTRTGWPELAKPVPYGEMIPLYGDYADGFWERTTGETDGNYYKAFNFKTHRKSTAIATEQLGEQSETGSDDKEAYPYLTCELGSGMATAYHRRPYVYPEDAYSMTIVKLGSGSNMPGYYMYHGGTNPCGKLTSLNEHQGTPGTNYNDMPVMTYDFQAPVDECGLLNPHYYMLRKLHLFLQDYGEMLAPMQAVLASPQDIEKTDDSALRWSYRTDTKGESAFVFVNNYQRLQPLSPKKGVRFDVCGVKFPAKPVTIPAGAMCIFPVNVSGIRYATAQIVANRDGKIYLEQIPGIPTEIALGNKVLKNVKPLGVDTPVADNIYLITSDEAETLFGLERQQLLWQPVEFRKVREHGPYRTIAKGAQKVAVAPSDADFDDSAVYEISLPDDREHTVIELNYRGDCARIYADGKLIDDNFYNGRPFRYPLWRLPADTRSLTVKILPIQPGMPVYFPREADTTEGEALNSVKTAKTK